MEPVIDVQSAVCLRYSASFLAAPPDYKIGISKGILADNSKMPINGLRHITEKDTSGWYIWNGEYSEDPDFFVPLHIAHLYEICPLVVKYLGLAPGWRFVADNNGYEDVWHDKSLLISK